MGSKINLRFQNELIDVKKMIEVVKEQQIKNEFFKIIFKNWSIVNLQCCIDFRCIAKGFSLQISMCVYIYIFPFFSITGCYKILHIVPFPYNLSVENPRACHLQFAAVWILLIAHSGCSSLFPLSSVFPAILQLDPEEWCLISNSLARLEDAEFFH